jgi:hypothetical protein
MLLRVYFEDSDFSRHFELACEEFIMWHGSKYKRLLQEVPLEEIRKGIIVGALGSFIKEQGVRSHVEDCILDIETTPKENVYDISRHLRLLDYFDKKTKIEIVETFNEDDWNAEACYIDFYNAEVHLT